MYTHIEKGGAFMEEQWLKWAKQLQAIAQAGLAYSKDVFDIERFKMIRIISLDIMAHHTDMEIKKIKDLFANDTGYPTPKVDVRAAVFYSDQILMVQEKSDGKWSLPGGWADIGYTPAEIAVKEVKEETGFDVKPVKLIAVFDKKCHPHPPSPFHVYKMMFQCELLGGKAKDSIETSDVRFFSENQLPPLSIHRITKEQIELAFYHLKNPQTPVYFD
ncbi:ADP-ribose pyrophosphatase YjhB (NUDIX family) [Bacillus oleivorans]|uniref:ADP-ribose pyrophosphatase YjhB (NUDIX family) n=2 Tax=Bacillus oleivorans TaxID=1448271 RepID=A0A285CMH3_9BACI|nr:ADP-ribose pyrophosphatase YjhB (NUDIX family) [Bacillus oleivorans]